MWRRRMLGLAAAWFVAVAGLAVLLLIPNRYEASARLFVDTQSILKPLMAGLAVQPNIGEQVSVLSRTLLSRPNIERLIRMADLDLGKNAAQRARLVNGLIEEIQLKGTAKDNLYWITYRDTDPGRARRVVESLLSIFVESGLGNKRRDSEKAQQFLQAQIAQYERQLADAERRLKDFKLRNLQHLGQGESTIASMMELDTQISEARTELRAAEQARAALQRQLQGEEAVFLPEPGVVASRTDDATEYDARIATLEGNLDELLRHYTEAHPDVAGTRRVLAEIKQKREAQLESRKRALEARGSSEARQSADRNPVYQQLKLVTADAESKVAALRARVADLEGRHARLRNTARLRPELEEQLGQLNRDYQVHKSNYEGLVARRESAKLTGELDESAGVADFRIIDPPRVADEPVAPDRRLLLGMVLVAALAAGLAVSFVASQMLPTFHDVKVLQRVTQRPVLGAVSFLPTPAQQRVRRSRNLAFAGAVVGLFALFGCSLVLLPLL
jgi:polysaccharide chain length determinant protein (PEP-CTERM system associated)